MISKKPEDYMIELGPMGPIGEGEALLLRINRNCPWNQCLFCPVYKGKRFSIREVDEVKRDIDAVRRVCDLLETEVNLTEGKGKEGIETFIKSHPEIYGEYPVTVTEQHWLALQSLSPNRGIMARSINSGAMLRFAFKSRTLFLLNCQIVSEPISPLFLFSFL